MSLISKTATLWADQQGSQKARMTGPICRTSGGWRMSPTPSYSNRVELTMG